MQNYFSKRLQIYVVIILLLCYNFFTATEKYHPEVYYDYI